jgi:hypothetical protein
LETDPPISDEKFMKNVREARQLGFDLVCVDCGQIYDLNDEEENYTRCSVHAIRI